jgi:hypothetical protein
LLFSKEPLYSHKLGDQPIKIAEILISNGQNKSIKPQLTAVEPWRRLQVENVNMLIHLVGHFLSQKDRQTIRHP